MYNSRSGDSLEIYFKQATAYLIYEYSSVETLETLNQGTWF